MSLMIFQASRRQLLAMLIEEHEKLKQSPTPQSFASSPSAESSASESSERQLLSPQSLPFATPPPIQESQELSNEHLSEAQERKTQNLRKAIEAAEQEVLKLEYWSDIRGVAANSEGALRVAEGQRGEIGAPPETGIGRKGKGKEVQR
jgi:hypothetical protein